MTNQTTFSIGNSDETFGLEDFNAFVGAPNQNELFDDTGAGQFSQLFGDAILFDSRVYAEEDRTDNAFGVYDAGALSLFTVSFRVSEDRAFTLLGERFDASRSSRPGTTSFSLTGPGVSIVETNNVLAGSGLFEAGETYTVDVIIESIGQYVDDFLGVSRTRGEDLGFDFELVLDPIVDFIPGDYDGSGQVEQGDLNLVLNNWGQPRSFEDPGGDSFTTANVDQEELNRVLNNWGDTGAAPNLAGSAVPEPGLAAAALIGLAALRRRG
ncbi:MAG: hypothetical protein AAGE65_12590 [Planctomycetota bacterium]